MTEIIKKLNAAETAAMSTQADEIAATPAPKVDAHSGEKLVFVAHFDGTNNDKDNVKLSGSAQWTNVAQLYEQMEGESKRNPNFKSFYYPGVGTDPGFEGLREGSFMPSADMRETADKAYREFSRQATTWLKAHPNANPLDSLQIMATGFSRGSGTAAVFSQLLHERGLTDPATGKVLVPKGQLGLAGALALDPVTTGYSGNSAFSPTSQNITVVRANNEYRVPFKGVDHSGHAGVATVGVAGNHCDVGGGYDNGIAARVLESSTAWMKKAGVPIADVPPARRHDGTATVHHERNLPKTDGIQEGASKAAEVARQPWYRLISPFGSRVAEETAKAVGSAAGAADYPLTHEPKKGLDAPRQLTGAAKEETLEANGWKRFEGAQATVWRKEFPAGGGATYKATVTEAHLKHGEDSHNRVSVEAQGVGANGRAIDYTKSHHDGHDPRDVMRATDAIMAQRAPARSAEPPLHPALKTLEEQLVAKGYTQEQAHKIGVYAQSQLNTHELAQLKYAGLLKDQQGVGLRLNDFELKEFTLKEALAADGQRERAANAAAPSQAAVPATGTTPAEPTTTAGPAAPAVEAPGRSR